jgi:capsular polysaccharide transport system permease protein
LFRFAAHQTRIFLDALLRHFRIMHALLLRELSTRYGRNNIGFLWIMGEPILFAAGVSVLWSQIRPPYENGIPMIPFIVTGYMPLILLRQIVGYSVNAVKGNATLLYHRMITPLHLILSRSLIEFIGITMSFVVIVVVYHALGFMMLPPHFTGFVYIYGGWFLLAWVSVGVGLVMSALAEIFEVVERVVQIVTYVSIPVSGSFLMAADMTPKLRAMASALPLIHCLEMLRHGYFGDGVVTLYNWPFAVAWAAVLTLLGLILVHFVRARVEID